jgi:hypothetical protein
VIRWQGQRKLGRRKGGPAATLSAVLVSRLIMWPRRSSATHRFRKAISAPRSPRAGCRGNGLAPDFPGGVDHKSELCALLTSVIGSPAAALAKPHWGLIARAVEVEVSGRVLDAASEHIHILKLRCLAADETQHDALRSGHQSQRSKAPGPGGIIFKQEVIRSAAGRSRLPICSARKGGIPFGSEAIFTPMRLTVRKLQSEQRQSVQRCPANQWSIDRRSELVAQRRPGRNQRGV